MTHGGVVSHIVPVVVSHIIVFAIAREGAAQGGVGVQLAIGADELLSVGHSINIVAQVLQHDVVSPCVQLVARQAMGSTIVGILCIVSLIILAWVGNNVIVLHGASVGTPLGINRNLGIAVLAALGGDNNHTSSATSTIQGSRGGIFQNGNALDVVGGNA